MNPLHKKVVKRVQIKTPSNHRWSCKSLVSDQTENLKFSHHTMFKFSCTYCGCSLFNSKDLILHESKWRIWHYKRRGRASSEAKKPCAETRKGFFIRQMQWMFEVAGRHGSVRCPTKTCGVKIGEYNRAGHRCSCGTTLVPAFLIWKASVKMREHGHKRW